MTLKEVQLTTSPFKRRMRSNHRMALLAKEDSKTDSRISSKSSTLVSTITTTTPKVTTHSHNKESSKII